MEVSSVAFSLLLPKERRKDLAKPMQKTDFDTKMASQSHLKSHFLVIAKPMRHFVSLSNVVALPCARGMVKWVSAFSLRNNIKWRIRGSRRLAWSVGQQSFDPRAVSFTGWTLAVASRRDDSDSTVNIASCIISPIPADFSVAWSVVCRLSACRLSYSCTLLKPFDGFRCHLAGTLAGSSDTLC